MNYDNLCGKVISFVVLRFAGNMKSKIVKIPISSCIFDMTDALETHKSKVSLTYFLIYNCKQNTLPISDRRYTTMYTELAAHISRKSDFPNSLKNFINLLQNSSRKFTKSLIRWHESSILKLIIQNMINFAYQNSYSNNSCLFSDVFYLFN